MGVGGADNPWWLSVLEWGSLSPFADAFDIDWQRLGAGRNLVIPFLGERYGEALEQGTLELKFDPEKGAFSVWHYEHQLPIRPLSYPTILNRVIAAIGAVDDDTTAELLAISERLRAMGIDTDETRRKSFPEEAEALKRRLAEIYGVSPLIQEATASTLALLNGFKGRPDSFGPLHRLLEAQAYRLAHWRVASSDINYRRFFDVNSLAGLRVELSDIFHRSHETVFRLVREGRIDGLRIDHIDGLADPLGYARALQAAVGPGFYVVVEKILEPGERLRPWPVAGTTGYDVLNQLDGLLVDKTRQGKVKRLYEWATGFDEPYGFQLRAAKAEILEISFASELKVLTSDLKEVADADRRTRDFTVNALRRALIEVIARFPTYRSYLPPELEEGEVEPEDVRLIEGAVAKAKRWSSLPDRSVHDFAADVLLGRIETASPGRPDPRVVLRFRRRFQQLTGPVMAKSLEDTLSPLLVPARPQRGRRRSRRVRARRRPFPRPAGRPGPGLAERHDHHGDPRHQARGGRPHPAARPLGDPRGMGRRLGSVAADRRAAPRPDRRRARPGCQRPVDVLPGDPRRVAAGASGAGRAGGHRGFPPAPDRLRREGHARGQAAVELGQRRRGLRRCGQEAVHRADRPGLGLPGAAQALRPAARPSRHAGEPRPHGAEMHPAGLPDTYQGTEIWDFSFVDPDNRRPVDSGPGADARTGGEPAALLAHWPDGRVKQATLARLLAERAERPDFYASASYEPVEAKGARAAHVIAYRRTDPSQEDGDLFVAVPRLFAGQVAARGSEAIWSGETFAGTRVDLGAGPAGATSSRAGPSRARGRGTSRSRPAPARAPLRGLRREA